LEEQTDDLALPITVLAEACYLIDRFGGPPAEAQASIRSAAGRHIDSAQ
jgi:hypothetical protein